MKAKSAEVFEAMSHPTRLKIVELTGKKTQTYATLAEALEVNQSTVSYYMMRLSEVDLLDFEYEGRIVRVSLRKKTLERAIRDLARSARLSLK
jgi:DNA-binding transcriptional ArsR family regulator